MSRSSSTLPPLPGTPGMVSNKSAKKVDSVKRMEITIHVCDEAKNLKKDFSCPKALLLKEMKYFQDYLSSDNQTWEDIDISVHCDVKIFDWLMRYVKRDKENPNSGPILSAKSAVSILISSDFLKMGQLVEECIKFCHDHLSEIIGSPCNMNCINDGLVKRIAATFTQHDLEKVVDRKDKFKSKLFCKKIEELFDPRFKSVYCPNNACSLYMCLHCRKLLLPSVENRIECTVSRTMVDQHGNLQYVHFRDTAWEIQEYLVSLKTQFKTWRCVFWKLWSVINFFECSHCQEIFPLNQYNCCRYHPEKPVLDQNGSQATRYLCCGKNTFLFEPISSKTGCQYKEHEVNFGSEKESPLNSEDVLQELLSVVDLVCSEESPNTEQSNYSLEAMIKTELSRTNKCVSIVCKEEKRDKKRPISQKHFVPNSRTNKGNFPIDKSRRRKNDQTEEDTSEPDEPGIVRIVIQHKDSPTQGKNSAKTWNTDLPVRLNQDLQRESDIKRMNDMMQKLVLNRGPATTTNNGQDKFESMDAGLYHKIESKLKSSLAQQTIQATNSSSTNLHGKSFKFR